MQERVVPHNLCDQAETKLRQSLTTGAFISAVNEAGDPIIIFKFTGKLAGLCVQDYRTSDGRNLGQGIWYTPAQAEDHKSLELQFAEGSNTILVPQIQYHALRKFSVFSPYVKRDVINMLENERLPVEDRFSYRISNFERMHPGYQMSPAFSD